MMVAVEFYNTMLRILSKQMKLLHVAQGFYILGNGGLKCEQMGVVMGYRRLSVENKCILSMFISIY